MSFFQSRQLKVKAKTWARDTTGLYDHEDAQINVQSFTIKKPCNISRANHQIIKEKRDRKRSQYDGQGTATESNDDSAALATIINTPVGIQIVPTAKEGENMDKGFWRLVEKGKDAMGTMLKVGDVIRLGRTTFKMIKIKTAEEGMKLESQYKSSLMSDLQNLMKKEELETNVLRIGTKEVSSSACCRICLSDTIEPGNPFITPCNCIGSVKHVHLECLQQWVKCRLDIKQDSNIITLMWKNLHCELCKERLPLHFIHEGKELSLIPVNNISGSYIVLESFSKDNDSTGIHVIDIGQNREFKIGRGAECDLKIQDISVSRVHASLIVSKGKLYVRDNISKFGTLILQQYPIVICDENPRSCWIQCGRTLFQFSIKKSWVLMLPWCSYSGFGMNSGLKSRRSSKKTNYNLDRQTQLPENEQEELHRSLMMV